MKKLAIDRVKDLAKQGFFRTQKTDAKKEALIKNLDETKQELESLNHSLNYITDPILINQLIFQIKAVEVRYRYWFCMAREMEAEKESEKTQTNV